MYKAKIITWICFTSISMFLPIGSLAHTKLGISAENHKTNKIASDYFNIKADLISEISTLYPDNAFGLRFFPDLAVTVINSRNGYPFRMFVVAGVTTYLFEGDSINAITHVTQVLSPGNPGEFDNGYAGIGGVYYHSDGKMYALYHGEDQEDLPDFPDGINGFYASVGLAISEDNGLSFTKAGPVITCQKDKYWESFPGQPDRGSGAPCCIKSKDGKYLYAYYGDASRVDWRGVQIFMARADISSSPPLPGNFYKYYNGSFSQPGIGGLDSPIITVIDKNYASSGNPFVIYSDYLEKYIMLYDVDDWYARENDDDIGYSGNYVAYSEDGINWFNHDNLIAGIAAPIVGETMSWHPAVIWDDSNEQTGLFVYAYSSSWGLGPGLIPHYMVSQKIKFEKYLFMNINGEKDPFYDSLSGPDDGYLQLRYFTYTQPQLSRISDSDDDLSAKIWTAWDNEWFYLYEEVTDDTVAATASQVWDNDALEIKIDPIPDDSTETSTFELRLTALGDADVLPGELTESLNNIPNSMKKYARKITSDGYALEMAVKWSVITNNGEFIVPAEGEIFGATLQNHDNDGETSRHATVQWGAVMSDMVWNTPKYLGTIKFLVDHKLQFIPTNSMTGVTNPIPYDGSDYHRVSVGSDAFAVPLKFNLQQNYPNPFNPETTIRFDVKEPCQVVLRVYNLMGQKVIDLVNEDYQPGAYEVKFDAAGLSSGIYFFRIQMGSFNAVKKMVVLG